MDDKNRKVISEYMAVAGAGGLADRPEIEKL